MKHHISSYIKSLALLLLLVAAGGASAATETFTQKVTLTAVDGTAGFNNEGYTNLTDGDTGTKWCTSYTSGCYVTFDASSAVSISQYTLTTGNDTQGSGRNPVDWVLYGANDNTTATEWIQLDAQTNASLPNANKTAKTFKLSRVSSAYRYFKIVFTGITSGSIIQLSEISFNDFDYSDVNNLWRYVDNGYVTRGLTTVMSSVVASYGGETWKFDVKAGGSDNRWGSAININTGLSAKSGAKYDFAIMLKSSTDIAQYGAAIRLADVNDAENYLLNTQLLDNGNSMAPELVADNSYVYIVNGATLAKDVDINGNLMLTIDMRGVESGTTITIEKIYLTTELSYTFEHYVGDVYGSMTGTRPSDLQYSTDYKTHTDDARINEGVTLQRAHEYNRDVYVFPGDTCELLPFSDYKTAGNYYETYGRWFDYTTDKKSDRLDFGTQIVCEAPEGVFGCDVLTPLRKNGSYANYISPDSSDDDGIMDVLAIDVSMSFNEKDHVSLGSDGVSKHIKEPTLQFRNKFYIRDAKKRADDMTASAEANKQYIAEHKMTLMCPADVPFQYPLPSYERWDFPNKVPTDYWYKKDKNGVVAQDYAQVYHYLIQMYKYNESTGGYDKYGHTINLGHEQGDNIPDNCKNLAIAFKPDAYRCHELYIAQPKEGKYKIELIAIENNLKNNNVAKPATESSGPEGETTDYFTVINIIGTDTPLVLAEYELDVLPVSKGNMVCADTLKNDATYKYQRPDVMNKVYGTPTTVVNFDDIDEADTEVTEGQNDDVRYYKWPWKWESSSYGFGYKKRYDYNQYVVINDTWAVGGYNAASHDKEHFDRLYYDTGKKGYMFFANAAGEPGRMALLNIGKNFCQGTRVYVSAWLMESSKAIETANVVFSFRGVKSDGTEVTLNNFVSGYVTGGMNMKTGFSATESVFGAHDENNPDYRGQWMHIYWEFETNVTSENYDHFIIVLENNSANSAGADYAIDDIRCYVRRPIIYAQQETPVCNGSFSTPLKMYSNFEQLLTSFGLSEVTDESNDTERKFYYAFIDKDKYDTAMETAAKEANYTSADAWKAADTDAYQKAYVEAYDNALVRNTYGESGAETYGVLSLHTCYAKNDNVDNSDITGSFRNVYFNTTATDTKMSVNTTYYVAMLDANALGSGETPSATKFAICDACSKISEFEVIFSGQVKIDGVLDSEMDGASYCANQKPIVTIDLKGIDNGTVQTYSSSSGEVYFDLFMGPYKLDDYYNQKKASDYGYTEEDCYLTATNKDGIKFYEAEDLFRAAYPTATATELLDGTLVIATGQLTEAMIAYLKELVVSGKLVLYQKDFTMSTMDQYKEERKGRIYSTVIPLRPADATKDTKFCLEPVQIAINISTRAPQMKDGDDSGVIHYPSSLTNVPLRIGLAQLKRCVMADLDATTSNNDLYIPLRDLKTVTTNVNELGIPDKININKTTVVASEDNYIYLASSTDPNVAAGTSGAVKIENSDLKCIGKLLSITADKRKTGNIFHLAFIKDFKFREGYEYMLKFHFEEVYAELSEDQIEKDVCPGDVVFTIKVVPEYEMWTGAVSRNWNDDANWRRVSSSELFADATDDSMKDYITDSKDSDGKCINDNTLGYVPADFTKVIIPADAIRTPYMYNMRKGGNLQEVNFTGAKSPSNYIKSTRPADADAAKIGYATDLIKYDMASTVANSNGTSGEANVACRAWYDHTCKEIHFCSGAEMMEQEYLHYDKAWCDIEVEPNKWYTISSPLQNVVAGDLYLPTNGARQNTQLFKDITYDTSLNDRFAPAVYQRSWNKGTAKVYKFDGNESNSGIKLDWSNVYNDVTVNYGVGVGFSIKVDVSALTTPPEGGKVKFRLPKADTQYTYYNPGNADGGKITHTVSDTDRGGKLAELSSTFTQVSGNKDDSSTKYFLVGNPLMCWLDMKAFFEENTQFAKKYWLDQRTAVMTDDGEGFISSTDIENSDDARYVEPGKSFFVELADGQTETPMVSPNFTTEMMSFAQGEKENKGQDVDIDNVKVDENDPNPTNAEITGQSGTQSDSSQVARRRAKKKSVEDNSAGKNIPMIHIVARTGDGRNSSAVLTDGETAKHAGGEMLMDSNLADDNAIFVYAAVEGKAMSVGSVNRGDTIPVAVVGNADDMTITVSGADSFDYPVYLLDTYTGESTLLTDEMTLDASESGVRYYIATESTVIDTPSASVPRVKVDGCTITAYAPVGGTITCMSVCGTDGVLRAKEQNITDSHSVTLAPGIYLVELSTVAWHQVYKFLLK